MSRKYFCRIKKDISDKNDQKFIVEHFKLLICYMSGEPANYQQLNFLNARQVPQSTFNNATRKACPFDAMLGTIYTQFSNFKLNILENS